MHSATTHVVQANGKRNGYNFRSLKHDTARSRWLLPAWNVFGFAIVLEKIVCLIVVSFFLVVGSSTLWAQAQLQIQDREVIEALFFGTGPLGANTCPAYQRWTGFPRGSHITIIVSTTVSDEKRDQIRSTLKQVSQASHGAITVSFQITEESEPPANAFQVISMTHPNPTLTGCVSNEGCTHHEWQKPGILKSSRAVQPDNQTPQAYAHDVIGHGILGMCHILANGIGGPEHSLMSDGEGVYSGQSSGRLTELDMKALQTVFSSNLSPGATRQDFIEAGLINP
ncbi:hypothetical protein [Candidatus Nitrospira salsa]